MDETCFSVYPSLLFPVNFLSYRDIQLASPVQQTVGIGPRPPLFTYLISPAIRLEQNRKKKTRYHQTTHHSNRSQRWDRKRIRRIAASRTFLVGFCSRHPRETRQLTRLDLGFTPMVKVSGEWEVEKVVDAIPGDAPKPGGQSPLALFHMIERLKTTKREGWRRFGIERYGSTQDPILTAKQRTLLGSIPF